MEPFNWTSIIEDLIPDNTFINPLILERENRLVYTNIFDEIYTIRMKSYHNIGDLEKTITGLNLGEEPISIALLTLSTLKHEDLLKKKNTLLEVFEEDSWKALTEIIISQVIAVGSEKKTFGKTITPEITKIFKIFQIIEIQRKEKKFFAVNCNCQLFFQ
jgi:hypothetical protein